jgi:hypothetical protein
LAKLLGGALRPLGLTTFVSLEPGDVHRHQRIEIDIGIDANSVRLLLGDRLRLWRKHWNEQHREPGLGPPRPGFFARNLL